MKKQVLLALALCVVSLAWGTTVTKTVTELATANSWVSGKYYAKFDLDGVVSVNANDGSNNGKFYENTDRWRLFSNADGFRPFVISAKDGYVITSATFTFSGNAGGTLYDAAGKEALLSNTAYVCTPAEQSVTFTSGYTGTWADNTRTDITQFTVTYLPVATDITLPATKQLNVGEQVQLGTVTPADAYQLWTTSDDSKVLVSETGLVKALAPTTEPVTITIRSGKTEKTCAVTVVGSALPEPTLNFADGNAVTKDMNVKGYVNTLTKDGDGEVSYESSDETVATVSNEGVITIIGEGATTITVTVAACATYTRAEASYTLTVTDPQEDAYAETFERNTGGASSADRVGAYYIWTITTGARTRETDKLFNGTSSIWLSGNGGASMATTIEGGVKRVGFLWNKFNKEASPIAVSVTAGDIERRLTKEVQTGETHNQNDPDLVFNSNFGIKSNTTLTIANLQNTTALQIGPISITPYIFYTAKDTVVDMTNVATFINDKFIDNRDDATAIVYSIVGENDGVATIDAATGEVTGLKAGTVTVQAAYGEATTSYTLTLNFKGMVDAKFATEGKLEKVLTDDSFTNAIIITAGDAAPTYTSDNTDVAEVDAEGRVTIKSIGTATITATMAETQKYLAWQDSYTLIVRTGVADNNKLIEHFTNMPKSLISTEGGVEVKGDIDVTWLAYNARRGDNDTIGGVGVQGNNIFTKGFIDSQEPLEGGIKYFSFNWKQWATENNCTLKLRTVLGSSEYSMEKAGTGPATYEHYFFAINAGIKSNVGIALYNESYNEEGPLASNGRITIDAFEIVPYLYYTQKNALLDLTQSTTFINDQLIDNRDDATAIVYSIIGDNDGVATIDAATGEVTGLKAGIVTIQAAWGDVTTTYTLVLEGGIPTAVSTPKATQHVIKYVDNGQIVLLRDGMRYNVLGTLVK